MRKFKDLIGFNRLPNGDYLFLYTAVVEAHSISTGSYEVVSVFTKHVSKSEVNFLINGKEDFFDGESQDNE